MTEVVGLQDRQAIFKVTGSLAALVREEVWEKLLKGEPVGVVEPDPDRWSLFLNGEHVKTFTCGNLDMAIRKAHRRIPDLWSWVKVTDTMAATHPSVPRQAEIIQGYPNVLHLPPETMERFRRAGTDAKKMALHMRQQMRDEYCRLQAAKNLRNEKAIEILGEEVNLFGMKREGRD